MVKKKNLLDESNYMFITGISDIMVRDQNLFILLLIKTFFVQIE